MIRDPYEDDHHKATSMSLGEHLEELRRRLIFGLLGLVPLVIAGLYFGEKILFFLTQPALDAMERVGVPQGMQTTGPLEGFNQYMKVAFLLAAIVGAPWLIFQLWKFISPGLYARERRFAYILGPMSVVLSLMGIAFMYYVMLPMVLFFFVDFNAKLMSREIKTIDAPSAMVIPQLPTFAGDPRDPKPGQMWVNSTLRQLRIALADGPTPTDPKAPVAVRVMGMKMAEGASLVQQEFRISEYISMVLTFAIAFAVAFQTPVVVLLLGWIGILKPRMMDKYRKHAIFVCIVIGAVIGPADPFSMFALAVPLYFLYEGGLLLLRFLPAERVAKGGFFQRRGQNTDDNHTPTDGDGGGEGPDRAPSNEPEAQARSTVGSQEV